MLSIFLLVLMSASGLLIGYTLTSLVKIEEAMVANGGKRNWKALMLPILNCLASLAVGLFLIVLVGLQSDVSSDQIAIFGIAAMALMLVPIYYHRWQQAKKKRQAAAEQNPLQ